MIRSSCVEIQRHCEFPLPKSIFWNTKRSVLGADLIFVLCSSCSPKFLPFSCLSVRFHPPQKIPRNFPDKNSARLERNSIRGIRLNNDNNSPPMNSPLVSRRFWSLSEAFRRRRKFEDFEAENVDFLSKIAL